MGSPPPHQMKSPSERGTKPHQIPHSLIHTKPHPTQPNPTPRQTRAEITVARTSIGLVAAGAGAGAGSRCGANPSSRFSCGWRPSLAWLGWAAASRVSPPRRSRRGGGGGEERRRRGWREAGLAGSGVLKRKGCESACTRVSLSSFFAALWGIGLLLPIFIFSSLFIIIII